MRVVSLTLILFSCAFAARLYPNVLRDGPEYPTRVFQQTLDHFDPLNKRTFAQRYWVNEDHWSGQDAPIFLYINGEGPVSGPPSSNRSFVVELAQQHQGIIVTLEHRYYGGSHPFEELSTNNLRFLSVDQALRDLENFIQNFRRNITVGKNAGASFKIFTIGVSYSGALSAWFRLKYPHVTEGSIASSGVVNAILHFDMFDRQIILAAGEPCTSVLVKSMRQLEDAILAGDHSTNVRTKKLFKAEILSDADFFLMMGDVTGELVQYGRQDSLCVPLVNAAENGQDLVNALANLTLNSWSGLFGSPYQYSQDHLKNTTVKFEWADRQWWWQTCSQLAYWQVAPEKDSVRSTIIDLDYFRSLCSNVFGEGTWPDTAAFNDAYGGNKTAATRVLFTNGSQDPWKWASVQSALSATEPAIVVECHNCGHGVDVGGCPGGCLPNDKTLVAARGVASKYVAQWLQ